MSVLKPIYKAARSVVIVLIMLVVAVYVCLYILLSVPSVQEKVKTLACRELSQVLGGKLEIKNLTVTPFSELLLQGVSLQSTEGDTVANISKVAAGIDLPHLIFQRQIVLNYAEIIGLDAKIWQMEKDGPLSIQFLIDALSPKDKSKPPTKFDLRFRNIVIRDSEARFYRPWMKNKDDSPMLFSDVTLSNLRLDLSIPALKNNLFKFDIRNMQAKLSPGINLKRLSAEITYEKNDSNAEHDRLTVENLEIGLDNSSFYLGSIYYLIGGEDVIQAKVEGFVTPSDFKDLFSPLSRLDTPWDLDLNATISKEYADIHSLFIRNEDDNSEIYLKCRADNINKKDSLNLNITHFDANLTHRCITSVLSLIPNLKDNPKTLISNLGDVSLNLAGCLKNSNTADISANVTTGVGTVDVSGFVENLKTKRPHAKLSLGAEDFDIGRLTENNKIGSTSFTVDADVTGFDKNVEGEVDLNTDFIELNHRRYYGLTAFVKKFDNLLQANVTSDDDDLQLELEADYNMDGENSTLDAYLDLAKINTDILGVNGKFADCLIGFNLDAHTNGNNADNITGLLHLSDMNVSASDGRNIHLDNLSVNIDPIVDDLVSIGLMARTLTLKSDWMDANISGQVHPKSLVSEIKGVVSSIFPSLVSSEGNIYPIWQTENDFTFDVELKGKPDLYEFLSTPVSPLSDIPIKGYFNSNSGKFELNMSTPHMRQGKDKLIRDSSLKISADSFLGMAKIDASTIYPAKKGDVQIALDLSGMNDNLIANVVLNPTMKSSLKGNISMNAAFGKIPNAMTGNENLSVHVDIVPSSISIKETVWNIAEGKIDYFGSNIAVNNFMIEHGNQYIKIHGTASDKEEDLLRVRLNDIDLDYIFSILNINYVTFGGMATGEVVGSKLLTKSPAAHTKFLRVNGLSYNGAVLGNGDLAATYFPKEQEVGIYAVIMDPLTRERRANIDGGIWVTRDSLSFTFDANKVNLQLMKPFVSAFCSDLRGLGSGKCKLYGTFSDIDLSGKLRADTISMKIDFTNTWYHAGGDSVFMGKGLIDVQPLTLYDSEGHTAELSGWLRHRYFHEPQFNFKIKDAKSILCYDTNEKLNPLWYGTIYASGNGQIAGRPGIVEIDMNMTTNENSRFYYVISDAEDTGSYSFLSFTDKRKEAKESEYIDSIPDYLHQFMRNVNSADEGSSNVVVSLKGSVTNDALLTLVMDPIAGDKITARGQGALQMDYNMAANDLRMIGTYVLEEGNYYFTLQDIIIKNFTIKPGSSIKFDGDPMNANLDIAATYRVNTNLTDLDQSFAQDKELNRTNVPVDAILLVDGPMTHPDIDFDIELPTLTSDVERKVKSIVSTNDMMSRQIIYLLALNRFYTQEYTGGTSNSGAEWSSMASSTISSQLSNILSNMTDKLSVAPSFRSDKGDFSDMEFDLALSSRLLNNRLLINGNFGYRDKESSNTQFVGDFDIEYLLNKNGNLRLKAYNHFNDQNYYLRSALTTQGVGVVFRRDFDHLFNIGKKDSSFYKSKLFFDKDKERTDSTSKSVLDVTPTDHLSGDSVIKH